MTPLTQSILTWSLGLLAYAAWCRFAAWLFFVRLAPRSGGSA